MYFVLSLFNLYELFLEIVLKLVYVMSNFVLDVSHELL